MSIWKHQSKQDVRPLTKPPAVAEASIARTEARSGSISSDGVLSNIGLADPDAVTILRRYISGLNGAPVVLIGRSPAADTIAAEFQSVTRWPEVAAGDISVFSSAIIVEDYPSAAEWPVMHELVLKGARYFLEACNQPIMLASVREHLRYFTGLDGTLNLYAAPFGEAPYRFHNPIVELNKHLPLAGKKVIEFGPLDGGQTAGLIKAGVAHLDAIEIRPENFAKLAVAKEIFGWTNLKLHFDNFHAVTSDRYGWYDAVFAHGVYYHSNSPLTFLENLCGLSDTILMGGFCATETQPTWDWLTFKDASGEYRAKPFQEVHYYTAGVSAGSYHFDGPSLQRFFQNRGFKIKSLEIEQTQAKEVAGEYVRFVAQR